MKLLGHVLLCWSGCIAFHILDSMWHITDFFLQVFNIAGSHFGG